MTAGFTELLTKQVALTGTETDLGALFGESTGKVRLSVPDAATSSVWLGKKGVSTSDDEYMKGTQTQLPTTSLRGWYAITNGASVTVAITMATGGVDAPNWITAGTNGASSGGGGGGSAVDQGAGDAASPWFVQGVGVAGTPAGGIVSMQGVSGGTAVPMIAGGSPLATQWVTVRFSADGANYWSIMANSAGVSAPGNSPVIWSMTRGRLYSAASTPGIVYDMRLDTWGRTYAVMIRNPTADGTTDAPTRFPSGGDQTAFSSGVAVVKATGGRLRRVRIHYTGVTTTGLYVALYNAASATAPSAANFDEVWPINANAPFLEIPFVEEDKCLSAGIKFAFTTNPDGYTAATSETGNIAAWGA